jgi:hypothetical protein
MSYRCSAFASLRRMLVSTTAAISLATLAGGVFAFGSAQAASTLPTVTATVSPTSIVISGALQSGAVNIASTATSGKEPAVVLVLLKPGVSVAELYAFLDSNKLTNEANLVDRYGSIVFDQEAGKGKPSEAQTLLVPGQYVALNGEGEKSVKWPRTSFTIAASPTPAALPAAQATEKTIDFGFKGPTVLKVGELVRFENEGYVVHMDIGFPVKSKKAAKQVVKALSTGREKGIEKLIAGEPIGFAGPLSSNTFQQSTITAKPGWYVQACFMTTQDGRPHTLIGMERIIKIVG